MRANQRAVAVEEPDPAVAVSAASDVRVFRVVPGQAREWQCLVRKLGGHAAHALEWGTAIRDTYGHEPLYMMAEGSDGLPGLLPAFIVRRPLVGTAVTSMPFLDGGGPLAASRAVSRGLVNALLAHACRIGANFVELRSTTRLPIALQPREHKVNLVLSLPSDPEALWRQLDGAVRSQVRKARRAGLVVEFGGLEQLEAFYAVHSIRMRELGSPVHHREFFRSVLTSFGSRARIAIVRYDAAPIGGMLMLSCNNGLTVPWASCLSQFFSLCTNMLLYWEAIRAGCLDGHDRFDFGRSTRGSGTYHFKRQWGALEMPLYWYTIPIRPGLSLDDSTASSRLVDFWKHLPLSVTRQLGPRVRKYLIQ
jgi:FemAB-related protein (PEP-CTERM system-associated)